MTLLDVCDIILLKTICQHNNTVVLGTLQEILVITFEVSPSFFLLFSPFSKPSY